MEIETLIQIVSLLDCGMSNIVKGNEYPWESSTTMNTAHMNLSPVDYGAFDALYTLREHLQEYIESKLNAAEIQMGE